jgi:copper(I)-binding protein
MKNMLLAAIAATSLFAQPALAHEYKLGDLVIDHPVTYETAQNALAAGGYLTITNNGTEPDRLLAAESGFDQTMLHLSETKDGIASMTHMSAVDIPAGETVVFMPGGLHVMFMGLGGDALTAGEKIPATLVFEKAGRIDVEFNVEVRDAADTEDHSNHGN